MKISYKLDSWGSLDPAECRRCRRWGGTCLLETGWDKQSRRRMGPTHRGCSGRYGTFPWSNGHESVPPRWKAPEGTGIGTIVFLVSGVDQPLNTPREPEFQGRGDPREGTNPWPSQSIESRLANVDRRARLIEIHVPPSCE